MGCVKKNLSLRTLRKQRLCPINGQGMPKAEIDNDMDLGGIYGSCNNNQFFQYHFRELKMRLLIAVLRKLMKVNLKP